jgi:hypothetical protein
LNPTLKGSSVRDYSQPGYIIATDTNGNIILVPTVKGTSIKDYSQPGYVIKKD